ncbi:hypothetical protein D3C81_1399330 [compost metagenome]
MLGHQRQPDERIDFLVFGQNLQQWVAIMLRHLWVAQCMHFCAGVKPQPRKHPAFKSIRRPPAIKESEPCSPQSPEWRYFLQISRGSTIAQRFAPTVQITAAVNQTESISSIYTQLTKQLPSRGTWHVKQQHIKRWNGQKAVQIAKAFQFQGTKTRSEIAKNSNAWS